MADIKQIELAGTTYNLVDDSALHSVSAASALTTGITTGTITIEGTTTTFYAPGKTYYLIEFQDSVGHPNYINYIKDGTTVYRKQYLTEDEYYDFLAAAASYSDFYYCPEPDQVVKLYNYTDSSSGAFPVLLFSYITNFTSSDNDISVVKFAFSEMLPGYALQVSSYEYAGIKVQQNAVTTTAGSYPVMLGGTAATTAITSTLNKTDSLTYNPSTKLLQTGALGVISGIGYTTTLPTSTAGYQNGQIMFVVFDET